MKLRDRMIYAGIVMSDMKRRHPAHVREFYRDLLHACDDTGRFEANVRDLRSVLFAPILDRVSERAVQGYLQALHVAGDIKLYTVGDRGFGKVTKWRQLRLKRKIQDYPDEDGEIELPLDVVDPPAPPREGRKEGSVSRKRSPAPVAPSHTQTEKVLAESRISELEASWPEHDIKACLRRASRYLQRERGEGAAVEYGWFSRYWLPNEPKSRGKVVEFVQQHEPDNFVEWFTARYDEPPKKKWANLTAEQRGYYLKQMGGIARWSGGIDTPCQNMGETSNVSGGAA